MTTEIFFLNGDGSEPTPIDLLPEQIIPSADRALLHWATTDPHVIAVIVDGVTIGSLPRRLAAETLAALRALHIFANPIQVTLVSTADGPALDLPSLTIERVNAPTIKPTVYGTPQAAHWPEAEPQRPELRQAVPSGYEVRTLGDYLFVFGLRIAGFGCLGAILALLGFLLLYILDNIFF